MVVLLLVLRFLSLLSDAALTVMAEVVVKVQAPPAAVLTQEPQCQVPTARLFLVLPQIFDRESEMVVGDSPQ